MAIYWPFDLSTITEWCGTDRGGGVKHMGTDFGVPQGTPLRATISGRITRWNNDGLGAYVLDIVRSDGLLVRNAHLSRMDVNNGDQVVAGQVIGLTGGARGALGSGNSTGPHLHWELRWDRLWQKGSWVDPRTMGVVPFGAVPAPVDTHGSHIAAEGSDWTYWLSTTTRQAEIQTVLKAAGVYAGGIDGNLTSPESVTAIKLICGNHGFFDLRYLNGDMTKTLCDGILKFAYAEGGYRGRMDYQIDDDVWNTFSVAVVRMTPKPVVPVVVPPVVVAPVVEPEPVVPEETPEPVVEPEPVIETIPEEKKVMTPEEVAAQKTQIAAMPAADLGAIIKSSKNRMIAYSIFALVSMLVTNTAVYFSAVQTPFPAVLVGAMAILGNLAVPFAALAVANAKNTNA
jgi:murein DD-endopeptidase MepM/ murein hydrolase activator NlpD